MVDLYPYKQYKDNLRIWSFMELSHQGGKRYKDGRDAEDNEIFQKHKKEDDADARLRKGRSSVTNYCRFFSDRFAGYLGKKEPERCTLETDGDWKTFIKDSTGSKVTFAQFVREWQKRSLRLSPYWARIDTPTEVPETLSDQIRLGVRPKVSLVDPRNVMDYEIDDNGELVRIVIREERRFKVTVAMEEIIQVVYTEWSKFQIAQFIREGDTDIGSFSENDPIQGVLVGEPRPNPWGFVPYVPLHFGDPEDDNPVFSASMTHDVSNFQRDVFRLLSLLYEELFDRTFTTTVVFGADANEVHSQLKSTLLCIKDKGGSIEKAGSDTRQTEALLDALHFAVRNTFRVAQFEASGDAKESRTAESGEKRARDLEGLYQVLSKFSEATENAENKLIWMFEKMMGKQEGKFSCSTHPRDFDVQLIEEDINQLIQMTLADMPVTFLNKIRRGIMQKMRPNMTEKDWSQIERELQEIIDELEAEAEAAAAQREAQTEVARQQAEGEAAPEESGVTVGAA